MCTAGSNFDRGSSSEPASNFRQRGGQRWGEKHKLCTPADKKSSDIKSGDRGGQVIGSPLPVSVGGFDPRILKCEIMEALRLPE